MFQTNLHEFSFKHVNFPGLNIYNIYYLISNQKPSGVVHFLGIPNSWSRQPASLKASASVLVMGGTLHGGPGWLVISFDSTEIGMK